MFLLVKPTASMCWEIRALCFGSSRVLMAQGRLVTIIVDRRRILPVISFIQNEDSFLFSVGSSSKPSSTNNTPFPASSSTASVTSRWKRLQSWGNKSSTLLASWMSESRRGSMTTSGYCWRSSPCPHLRHTYHENMVFPDLGASCTTMHSGLEPSLMLAMSLSCQHHHALIL